MQVSLQASTNDVSFERKGFFARLGSSFVRNMQLVGLSRAVAELHRQGYHEAANNLMREKLELSKKES